MPADTGDKTEAPTPRRLQEAREKGQVAKSADLSAALGLLTGLLLLYFFGQSIMNGFMDVLRESLALHELPMIGQDIIDHDWRFFSKHMMMMVGPFFIILFVVAIAVNLGQVGFLFSLKPITPSFDKISPIAGFRRLFSMRTAVRFLMNISKVIIIAVVAYVSIKNFMPQLLNNIELDFTQIIADGGHMMFILGIRLAVILLVLAIFDYGFHKFQMSQDLRMSRQEVREELKRMEGDPLMRQRRRNVARQLAQQRMAQAVPQADVIVTNPTHLAIALKYDNDTMPAPKVVAKGADYMAQRIRQIAIENNIPIIERKPLAQALYKACEIGDFVPPELYRAVAEVLAYVFELAGKGFRKTGT